ncbi:decarboxylating 6-phosphogluconate dehydrogenase [Candidatus Woesearchaeota archaeon]|nr:decarboxylating 6-phosphogluconate dehydrogenase [Candidatus Woesearchaeota archaeon]
MKKHIGFIGLGRMGYNIVLNLLSKKYKVIVYNRSPEPTKKIAKHNAIPSYSLSKFIDKIPKPRIIWLMITSGKPIDDIIKKLIPYLSKNDIVIDGGNSYYRDSIRRYNELKKKNIHFIDCGTSGGIFGARHGASMMIGGDKHVFNKIKPLFRDLCVKNGYGYVGKSGSGHFVKMVHNGIEYGMMGSIAEGFQALNNYKNKFNLNLREIAKVYNNGSIIQSKLTSLLFNIFNKKNYLDSIEGTVPKGETEEEMKHLEKLSNMPILNQARLMRVKTRKKPSFAGKILAALRNQFGGHRIIKK